MCEGELDAIRLAQEATGASVLSVPHGAETFKPEWADELIGKDVAIIFDRDEAGRKGAAKAAGMIYGKTASVCIVELPDGEYAKDVTEFLLQSGHTGADIVALVVGTAPYEPPPSKEKTPPSEGKSKKRDREVTPEEHEPWPEPVDTAELLESLWTSVLSYLVMRREHAKTVALWVLHTYTFEMAEITPRLVLLSPEKRCGKTLLFEVLERLVYRPLRVDGISPSAMFRTIDEAFPTMLVDEIKSLNKEAETNLQGVLNSGYRRGGKFIKCAAKDFKAEQYSTFGPVALAIVGKIPWDAVKDRSIIIPMRRKKKDEKVRQFRAGKTPELDELGRKATRWAEDNYDKLQQTMDTVDPKPPDELNDRAADNWRHLTAIAEFAGERWPQRVREIALELSSESEDEVDSSGVQLLKDIKKLFEDLKIDRIHTNDLLDALAEMEDRDWPEYRDGRKITARQVSSLLGRFELGPEARKPGMKSSKYIKPKGVRIGKGAKPKKGYEKADFRDAFARYTADTPTLSVTSVTGLKDKDLEEKISVTSPPAVTDKKGDKTNKINDVTAVTDRAGGLGQERGLFDDK